jgi:hypothetical protein
MTNPQTSGVLLGAVGVLSMGSSYLPMTGGAALTGPPSGTAPATRSTARGRSA